ncbi:hypothetical protein C5167_024610 [Papaver somniferum]|uniref:Tafazzin family protein n=1 Tax=Papaver somniferum TaxID=3469 RepID=A0A4Y7JS11_PAPSO|nr:hypothetical protein C5167_024610 [Papaver somniferum]
MGRTMAWAARSDHLGGIPRKFVIMGVGSFSKVVASLLNSTSVQNPETLIRLVRSRPQGVPLITVSNHMSMMDDPLMWGFKGFPTTDARVQRWVLAAEDICFRNSMLSYLFRLGMDVLSSLILEHMEEALERLSDGAWDDAPIRRLKWGTASLIDRAPVTPIVLRIIYRGFEEVLPPKSFFGRRPPVPLWNKDIRIIVGEPIEFDLPQLRQTAISMSRGQSFDGVGWPTTSRHGLNEAAQRWLYTTISDKIRAVMEDLLGFGSTLFKLKV